MSVNEEKRVTKKVTLLNIDCMEYMATQSANAFDMEIVDPPYGRGEDGGIKRSSNAKQKNGVSSFVRCGDYSRKNWDAEPPDPEYFRELRRVSRHQIIWGVNYYPEVFGKGRIVWDKVNDGGHQSGAEIAYCSVNDRVDLIRYMWRGMLQGLSIEKGTTQQGDKSKNERRIHPTQKPIKLYEWLLAQYCDRADRVLDTHLGSGSSSIAAHYFGCDFVGCEIDKDYYDAAKERFNNETRQLSLLDQDETA